MIQSGLYFDLIAACREAGCPICRLVARAIDRYLDTMLNDAIADADVELRFVASRGLCNRHAVRLVDRSDRAVSIAHLHRAVVDNVLSSIKGEAEVIDHALRRKWPGTERQRFLAAMLNPHRECPVCEQQAAIEHMALSELGKYLFEPEFVEAFEGSSGLCLPHFRQALTLTRDEAAALRLIELQREHFVRLRDQLAEFIRNNDDRFSGEGFGAEGDSWRRAIGIVSGQKDAQ
jgi:hypothetical protein